MTQVYDIAFLGHYTKDTIVSAAGTRIVDGGAFNYGCHVAARMGLSTAAITRLAREDFDVADELTRLGVKVVAQVTPQSTCLRLEYPWADVDERVIHVTSSAGGFTREQVAPVSARAFVIGASMRGEVGLEIVEALVAKGSRVAADVQGFIRVARDGLLVYQPWPEKKAMLAQVDILKTDAVEAHMLTGETDIRRAARALADQGPGEVVLTHRGGLLVYALNQFHEANFSPRELVGRSGRGDTCVAAYVARRIDHSPSDATIWAAAVTSLKMEAEGPFRREIEEVNNLIRLKYNV